MVCYIHLMLLYDDQTFLCLRSRLLAIDKAVTQEQPRSV